MRLIKQGDGTWTVTFTVVWEVEFLAEVGDRWVPFTLPHTTDPIGEIHASSYEVRLYPGVILLTRQVVTLVPLG